MKYDVFISYRKEGGSSFAMILKKELEDRGLKVFLDVEDLKSGQFTEQLYHEIEASRKVVLVLSPNALERCINDPEDWVRLEVTHAIQCGIHIIPVVLRGFEFPKNLPKPLDSLPIWQRLEPRVDHTFQASMDYLLTLINDGQGGSVTQDIPMGQLRTFASCGNETSVFRVKKAADGQSVSLDVNFEKTRLRPTIPEYAGIYYLRHPASDVRHAQQLSFQARSADCSICTLWVELKPKGRAWMHESFDFSLSSEFEECCIRFEDFLFPETLRCLEEITFVLKPASFSNEECLQGSVDLQNLKIS